METAAVSAVISTTLKVVANKLAPLLIKEYSYIVGVKRDLEDLRDQVEEINSWLETRYEAMWHDTSFRWLKRLKDIAYAVDDVVDEFQLKAEKHDAAADDSIMSKYMCTKPKSFVSQCEAASKIKKIKKIFAAIVKQRTDYYAITNSISVNPPVRQTKMKTGEMSSWPDIDEASVVGRDEDKKVIISKLEETDDQLKLKIISIIGLGGSGKTTLAKLIFNDGNIKKKFDSTLWVHVSKEFDVDKLVKKMFEAFADNNPGQHGVPNMRKTISDKLIGKRFLLVLDDVWTESRFQWENFWEFLINIGAPGSWILLTTRSSKVAEILGSTCAFELSLLSEASSWQLFTESYGMAENSLDPEFLKVGKEIVEKCGGVPLAIKVLAGVLRDKELIEEWEAMRNNSLLDVEGEEHRVLSCLRLSYLHLPSHLKQCFTICSVFPKGHQIDKEQLIDQWIVHDLITLQDGVDYLEYVGHKHFNSLVQMSFLNLEEKGERVTCRMHDLVHDLARCILGDEFFFLGESDEISTVVPMEATKSTNNYRYFSLIDQPRILLPKKLFVKARAVYVAAGDDSIFGKELKNARHLRSIMVEDTILESIHTTILQIKYLRYLSISYSWELEALPEAISDVWSLQALHVTNCGNFLKLPKSVGKLQKLRTLNLSGCRSLKNLPDSIGDCHMISSIDLYDCIELTMLPNSIGKLQKLRTLNLSWCNSLECLPDFIGGWHMISSIDLSDCHMLTVLPNSIGRNEKLRVLRLRNTKIERLPSSITELRNLECLDLCFCQELVELPEGIGNLDKLHVLKIKNCEKLGRMPVGIGQLSRMQKLDFFVVGESEKFAKISELANIGRNSKYLTIRGIEHVMDPDDAHRACLKQKTNLQRLSLQWMAHDVGEGNTELRPAVLDGLEPPAGIKELEICGYSGRRYAQWMQNQVGGGVHGLSHFPFLRVMELRDFPNLKHLRGLAGLPFLEELGIWDMPSLESISGGPFPSLVKLVMSNLPRLGAVWMVAAEKTTAEADGEERGQCSSSTTHLGHMTALQSFHIELCDMLTELPESLGSLTSLQSLVVTHCSGISVLPESLGDLQSLQELTIENCDSLSCLPQSMGQLSSLQVLKISFCHAFYQLPECLEQLYSLHTLRITRLPRLTCLPQSMCHLTSLESLVIMNCPGIKSLPEGIKGLTSLLRLEINACPDLAKRYNRENGEDWHLISDIPHMWIYHEPHFSLHRFTGEPIS